MKSGSILACSKNWRDRLTHLFFFGSCGNESYALPSKQRFANQSAKSLKHFSITIDHAAENELAQIGIVIKYTV